GHSAEPGSSARAALASEASGQRGQPKSARAGHSPKPGSSARAALASEASGQRGQPKSARAGHSPEPGSSARAALVRAMPNTPAAIGRGITVAVANARVSAPQREPVHALLSAVGVVEWVADEALMDAVTAVS